MKSQIHAPSAPLPVEVDMGTLTGTGSTVTFSQFVPGITADMRPLYVEFSNPAACVSDLTITAAVNDLTLSAAINGSTDIKVVMIRTRTANTYSYDPYY